MIYLSSKLVTNLLISCRNYGHREHRNAQFFRLMCSFYVKMKVFYLAIQVLEKGRQLLQLLHCPHLEEAFSKFAEDWMEMNGRLAGELKRLVICRICCVILLYLMRKFFIIR